MELMQEFLKICGPCLSCKAQEQERKAQKKLPTRTSNATASKDVKTERSNLNHDRPLSTALNPHIFFEQHMGPASQPACTSPWEWGLAADDPFQPWTTDLPCKKADLEAVYAFPDKSSESAGGLRQTLNALGED